MKVRIKNSDVYLNGEILEENKVYDIDKKHLQGLSNFYDPIYSAPENLEETENSNDTNETENKPKRRGRPRKDVMP